MSYYDKKIIKGSNKKEEDCKKEFHCDDDYCKKDDHCEKHDWTHECESAEIAGSVSTGTLLSLTVGTAPPTPLPLTSSIFLSEGIEIATTGGLIVKEDGEYFVQFTIATAVLAPGGRLAIFAGNRFLGAINGPLVAANSGKFAQIVRLRKGDLVQVIATGLLTVTVTDAAILTVVKVGE
ncbi:hypothetical protein [Priestia megaterium]|uniref:hypothetical protein n=1 Tax=Priestia megaterium TaxID=1404 RepID=UPI00203E635D|nr:hypothetical protein [Priestia megaterium]MCM3544078.1 hypothetical protein [Priestia megaterium]